MKKYFYFISVIALSAFVSSCFAVEQKDWSLEDAYKVATETREKICLNGVWDIRLAEQVQVGKDNIPEIGSFKKSLLAQIRTPGEWYNHQYFSPTNCEILLPIQGFRGPKDNIALETRWQGKLLADYYYALYERELTVPKDWKIEESFLHFAQINIDGWIFVNSKFVAYQTGAKTKDIALPSEIKPGSRIKLQVVVGAYVTGTQEKFAGAEMISVIQRESLSRGIVGDIWLIKRPQKNYIKNVFIITSVREKALKLKIEFDSQNPAGVLSGRITPWKKNEIAKEFKVNVKDAKINKGIYEYVIPWENPVYWSTDNPYLYELHLSLNDKDNKQVDSILPVRFGFRELWIQGVDYYLNGNKQRFRIKYATSFANEESAKWYIEENKEIGFNAIEMSYGGYGGGGYGMSLSPVPFINMADEMGFLVFYILPAANELRYDWKKPGIKERFKEDLEYCVKEIRNHPSIVHWSMNYNLLGYPFDFSPHHIATGYLPPDGLIGLGIKRVVQKDTEAMLREFDDSRPIIQHAGGNHGEISTSNMYMDFLQRQEKETWPMYWRTKGNKPFLAIELGMPYEATYFQGRDGGYVTYYTEELYTEYCSMFYGSKAYNMDPPEKLKPIVESSIVPKGVGTNDMYKVMVTYMPEEISQFPFKAYLNAQAYLGDFMKSWRAWGVCGYDPYENMDNRLFNNQRVSDGKVASYSSLKTPGIKTYFRYKSKYDSKTVLWGKYRQWMSPEAFYIAGPSRDFLDKKHAYTGGEDILKSIVYVNDTQKDSSASLKMEVKEVQAGAIIFAKEFNLKSKPGDIQFTDVTLKAPDVKVKTSYTMFLSSKENDKYVLKDSFAIQIFPKETLNPLKLSRKTWVIDKNGQTKKRLAEFGIKYDEFKGGTLGNNDLLIVGRESVSSVYSLLPEIKGLVTKGLTVLIFEQQQADLEKYCSLRAFESASRIVFLGQDNNPAGKGLSDEDMSDWTGKASLTKEYPKPAVDENPKHIWRFGNKGIVSTVVIEKPHQAGFVPLMNCEFDMGYTPLLENRIGQGSVIFCQLDVTARTEKSPVVDTITRNIIEYAGNKPANNTGRIIMPQPQGKQVLELAALQYEKIKDVSSLQSGDIAVICDKGTELIKNSKAALVSHMQKGGTVVLLALKDLKAAASLLDTGITEYQMKGYWFDYKGMDVTKGLCAGDFYWKDNIKLSLPSKGFPVYEKQIGKGRLVICQVDPLYFPESSMNQRRMRIRHKLSRIVSVLFTNLGAGAKFTTLDNISGKQTSDIDLRGQWKFRIDIDNRGLEKNWQKNEWTGDYKLLKVPGSWEQQGINTPNPKVDGKEPYDGYAWYQKTVAIPSTTKGIQLYSDMGNVDDCDWTYFNGELIGKIGKETDGYWDARRLYPIPSDKINYDKPNVLTVRVFDDYQEGGILKEPVRITQLKQDIAIYLDSNVDERDRFDPYLFKRW